MGSSRGRSERYCSRNPSGISPSLGRRSAIPSPIPRKQVSLRSDGPDHVPHLRRHHGSRQDRAEGVQFVPGGPGARTGHAAGAAAQGGAGGSQDLAGDCEGAGRARYGAGARSARLRRAGGGQGVEEGSERIDVFIPRCIRVATLQFKSRVIFRRPRIERRFVQGRSRHPAARTNPACVLQTAGASPASPGRWRSQERGTRS